jgi:acyl-CoA thioesterase I
MIAGNAVPLLAAAVLAVASLPGCGDRARRPEPSPTSALPAGQEALATSDTRPVVLVVGTSLTAGLGVDPSEAYPAILQKKIDAAGLGCRVVGAGVSGETSAGARRRMDWLMRQRVAALVVETGANDGLRGQDPEATRANIRAIFERARRQQPPPRLFLLAMEALPNYGEDYRRRFRAIYPAVAEETGAVLVPFFLEGVAGEVELNQSDGIHPTAAGHERAAENVWRVLGPALAGRAGGPPVCEPGAPRSMP